MSEGPECLAIHGAAPPWYAERVSGPNVSGVLAVPTRAEWQQLAEDRVLDAQALLAATPLRWFAAYYLAGYAVECGLKSCILVLLANQPDVLFRDKRFAADCWTHDLDTLVKSAGLEAALDAERATNPAFGRNWAAARGWNEKARYEQKTQAEAVTHPTGGVMQWIRRHW